MLRHSALRGRRLRPHERVLEAAVASRPGGWLFVHVVNRVDRRLLPATRGRWSVALGQPVGLLESRGARTGALRRTPLLYVADGEEVVLVASNAGSPRNPAWFANLRAHPDVRFLSHARGWAAYRARVAAGEERQRRWALANDLYAGYADYARRTGGREIPVVVLEPRPR